jgi:hypothetical protein
LTVHQHKRQHIHTTSNTRQVKARSSCLGACTK